MKKEDVLNVKFPSEKSKHGGCSCDCCHGVSNVLKLKLPYTKYHDGKNLSTKYNDWWICDDCRVKLIKALEIQE